MTNRFVGEIQMFGGNYAPAGWAFCNGQLMPIAENEVLFQLIGTTYGGDGQVTFGIPDLQGRLPIHWGNLNGNGQNFTIGEKSGTETVTLTSSQMPSHSHAAQVNSNSGTVSTPAGNFWAGSSLNQYVNAAPNLLMDPQELSLAGGSQPHDNQHPFLTVTFIISLFGLFPARS